MQKLVEIPRKDQHRITITLLSQNLYQNNDKVVLAKHVLIVITDNKKTMEYGIF